jgi:hypothetical protein
VQYLHLWDIVEGTNLTLGKVDAAVWRHTTNSVFSVKSAYNMFGQRQVHLCQADMEIQGAHEMQNFHVVGGAQEMSHYRKPS